MYSAPEVLPKPATHCNSNSKGRAPPCNTAVPKHRSRYHRPRQVRANHARGERSWFSAHAALLILSGGEQATIITPQGKVATITTKTPTRGGGRQACAENDATLCAQRLRYVRGVAGNGPPLSPLLTEFLGPGATRRAFASETDNQPCSALCICFSLPPPRWQKDALRRDEDAGGWCGESSLGGGGQARRFSSLEQASGPEEPELTIRRTDRHAHVVLLAVAAMGRALNIKTLW